MKHLQPRRSENKYHNGARAYVLAKCASWTDSAVIGKKIVLTSGDTIVVIPTIKKKDDKQKIRALIKIIEHRAYIKLK